MTFNNPAAPLILLALSVLVVMLSTALLTLIALRSVRRLSGGRKIIKENNTMTINNPAARRPLPVIWYDGKNGWAAGHAPLNPKEQAVASQAVNLGWRQSAGGWLHGPNGGMIVDWWDLKDLFEKRQAHPA